MVIPVIEVMAEVEERFKKNRRGTLGEDCIIKTFGNGNKALMRSDWSLANCDLQRME